MSALRLVNREHDWIGKLDYSIVPGKGGKHFEAVDLHNQAYSYWKETWTRVYESVGSGGTLHLDDFSRQDFIATIRSKSEIVGMHLYSLFRLDQLANLDHRYLAMFPEDFCKSMLERDVNYVMSLEYLTVDPNWRRSLCGISLAETLIGCGLRYFNSAGTDAVIALARTDYKVHDMGIPYGFDCLQDGMKKRNFEVALMVGFKDKVHAHSDPAMAELVDDLWNRRTDFTGITTRNEQLIKKAA